MSGSRGSRLLTRTLWAIASGGPEEPNCIEDYESVTTLLTEWLYVAAQMPHGTHAQQNVFRAAQRAGRLGSTLALPVRGARRLAEELRSRRGGGAGNGALPSNEHFEAVVRDEAARQAREQPLAGPPFGRPIYPEPTVISRSDPAEHALEAFAKVVANLGWDREAEQIVFAHTHQPLADVRAAAAAPPATGTAAAGSTSPTSARAGLRPLPALRLARHRDPDRRRRAVARAWSRCSPTSTR